MGKKKKPTSKTLKSFKEPPKCGEGDFKDKPVLRSRTLKKSGEKVYYCSKEPFATGWMRIRFEDWSPELWYPLITGPGGVYHVATESQAKLKKAFPLFTLKLGYGDKLMVTRGVPKKFGGYAPGEKIDWNDVRTQRLLVSWTSLGLNDKFTEKLEETSKTTRDMEKKLPMLSGKEKEDALKIMGDAQREMVEMQRDAIDRLIKRHGESIKNFFEKSEFKRKIIRIDYTPKGADFQATIVFA